MQTTILNLIINIAIASASLITIVIGCIHANRTVNEGMQREVARRRQLSAKMTA